mgnify:FL=1
MIRACIFDLGGTIVDRYSLTPFLSLKKVFGNYNISVTNKLIFKDMGKDKKDHLIHILSDQNVMHQWVNNFHRVPLKRDIDSLFNDFNKIQRKYSEEMVDVLPETRECIDYLQFNYIQTGVTTGFNQENMNIIRDKLERKSIYLDSYVSSTCLDKPSRPHPYMIQKNMKNLHINDPKEVIKVDDTVVGIHEGLRANCWTVGVARWSINMNLQSIEDAYGLDINNVRDKLKYSRTVLEEAGADFVIDTLDELPKVVEKINSM